MHAEELDENAHTPACCRTAPSHSSGPAASVQRLAVYLCQVATTLCLRGNTDLLLQRRNVIGTAVFVRHRVESSASWGKADFQCRQTFTLQEGGRLTGTSVCQHSHVPQGVGADENTVGARLILFAARTLR